MGSILMTLRGWPMFTGKTSSAQSTVPLRHVGNGLQAIREFAPKRAERRVERWVQGGSTRFGEAQIMPMSVE
jgi:hypothetical protein